MKQKQIVLFEDTYCDFFGGIAMLRPVWAIQFCTGILREFSLYPWTGELIRWVRPCLVDWQRRLHHATRVNEIADDTCLLINGRVLDASNLFSIASENPNEWVILKTSGSRTEVVAAQLSKTNQEKLLSKLGINGFSATEFLSLGVEELQPDCMFTLVNHPFDALKQMERCLPLAIERSIVANFSRKEKNGFPKSSFLIQEKQVHIHSSVSVGELVVFDASEGPILVDEGVVIESQVFLKGPLYVGKNSTLRSGLRLYGPCSVGPVCKLGGEIQNSLWMGYSNKQHDGYIGTAVIGSWVNIGAGTNNSDLKNTYGPITIQIQGHRIETGETHIGCLLGDHTKTSIGLQINTGTVTGIADNLFGAGFPPTSIPSFCWGGADWLREHQIEKAIETAKIAMSRRNKEFYPEIEQMFRHWFGATKTDREILRNSSKK